MTDPIANILISLGGALVIAVVAAWGRWLLRKEVDRFERLCREIRERLDADDA